MSVTRRRLLGLTALLPWITACDLGASPLTKKLKGLPMQPLSPEEIELLTNPRARPAWFAQHNLPQGQPLEIKGRTLGDARNLIRGKDIKDVRFVNCVFDMFQGYNNNLENVEFVECQFLGGVLTGDLWKNVRFNQCEADGPFKIGCADGDIRFEDCKLKGMTVKEGGYGNWSDHFGIASATDGRIRFQRCRLENIRGLGSTEYALVECEIGDLIGGAEDKKGTLLIEKCHSFSEKNQHKFSGSSGNARIAIRNSKLGLVDLMSATADEFEVTDSSLSLETGAIDCRFGKAVFRNSRFFNEGLRCGLAQIGTLLLENCTFDSSSQGLRLYGKLNSESIAAKRGPISYSRIRELTLRNQKLTKANMAYLQVGTFTVDNSSLEDCDLSHGHFGTWRFVNARLAGSLDLSETTIQRIDNQGLTQNAKVTGKLEASPDAPAPELQPPAVLGKGSKKS